MRKMQIQAMLKKAFAFFFAPKYHAFSVQYKYFAKGKQGAVFSYNAIALLKNRQDILNPRIVKKGGKPLHKTAFLKPYLCNGRLELIVISYIGKFSKPQHDKL